mmetsp:Transcript_32560/g.96941  ORF Transcript_32560/g.96941 Transcript_32560/m.96941 type:complete len:329 (-) Transcript_32560:51-1037(-)
MVIWARAELTAQQLQQLGVVKVRQREAAAEPAGKRAVVEVHHLCEELLLVPRHDDGESAAARVHLLRQAVEHLPRCLLARAQLVRVVEDEDASRLRFRADVLATHANVKVVVPPADACPVRELEPHPPSEVDIVRVLVRRPRARRSVVAHDPPKVPPRPLAPRLDHVTHLQPALARLVEALEHLLERLNAAVLQLRAGDAHHTPGRQYLELAQQPRVQKGEGGLACPGAPREHQRERLKLRVVASLLLERDGVPQQTAVRLRLAQPNQTLQLVQRRQILVGRLVGCLVGLIARCRRRLPSRRRPQRRRPRLDRAPARRPPPAAADPVP